jgi:tetratricopeptide (TPR) repeat protein
MRSVASCALALVCGWLPILAGAASPTASPTPVAATTQSAPKQTTPVRTTVALFPPQGPAGNVDAERLGELIQDRATALLDQSGHYSVNHLKEIVRMAEHEGIDVASLTAAEPVSKAAKHLGAQRFGFGTLAPAANGWTFSLGVATDAKSAATPQTIALPKGWSAAVEAGAHALANAIATLDQVSLPQGTPATKSDEAMQAYGRCFAVLVKQPIGIENPTVLLEDELNDAIKSCRAATAADPNFVDAAAALSLALAIHGDDAEAVKVLGQLSKQEVYSPLRWVALFWVVTRYQSNQAGASVLREAIRHDPGEQLLRGYLPEHLNAIGEQNAALAAWQEYVELNPYNAFPLARVGYTLERLGRHIEAIAKTRAALKLDPDSLVIKLELASREVDASEFDTALTVLKPLASRPDASSEVFLRLGYAELLSDDYTSAERDLKQSLSKASRPAEWRTRGRADLDLAKLEVRRKRTDAATPYLLEALREGYKPLVISHEDPDLAVLAEKAQASAAAKPAATPVGATKPVIDLKPHPREASPFSVDVSGDIEPRKDRPPPPQGFEVLRWGT